MINKIKVKIKEARPPLFLFFLSIFLFGGFFIPLQFASATTTVSSNISVDATWNTEDDVYIIQGIISINNGVTLTIDPGVIVKFQTTASRLVVNGILDAQGSTTSPIYFTSYKDDSVGGDTNGDATTTSPGVGNWRDITIGSTGSSTISNAVVRYGGYTYYAEDSNIYNNGGVLTISNSTVSNSHKYGIRQVSGTTTVTNCTLSDNSYDGFHLSGGNATIASSTIEDDTYYGIYAIGGSLTFTDNDFIDNMYAVYIADPDVLGDHSGNTATSSIRNGIYINGTLNGDSTWSADSMSYILGSVTINVGATLTVDSGAVVKGYNSSSRITVNGTLDAQGTSGSPIYFTSYHDDTVGGNTNGGGASTGSAGNWRFIEVNSTGEASFSHATVRYAGYTGSNEDSNIYVDGGVLILATSTVSDSGKYGIRQDSGTTTVTNCILSDNSYHGFYLITGNATIASSTIENNAAYGLYAPIGGSLAFTNNDFISNAYAVYIADPDALGNHSGNTATSSIRNGIYIKGTLNGDSTWSADSMSYIADNVTINVGATLTVDPGAIVKFEDSGSRLTVNGTLDAQGTEEDPIYFTSYSDDTVGGNTNGGGASTGSAGNWRLITISSTGDASFSHATVRYAGYTGSVEDSNIYNNGGVLILATSTVSDSGKYGIRQDSGTTTVTNCILSDNSYHGFYLIAGNATIASSTIEGNTNYGIYGSGSGDLTVTDTDFSNNSTATYLSLSSGLLFTHSGNTASGANAKNGFFITGNVTKDTTWTADTMPYIVSTVTVNAGKTLTIDPGAIIKFDAVGSSLVNNGTIDAQGTSYEPIYFTSIKDDNADGHDTDGASATPAAGNWTTIKTNAGATTTILQAIISYGGYSNSGNLYVNGGALIIGTSTVATSSNYGIYQVSGTTFAEKNVIRNNASYGAYNVLTATSTFYGERNFWNATSGPYHTKLNPSGGGDTISNYVSFDPWLGELNYFLYYHSVGSSERMDWEWGATSTQLYSNELAAGITTWNALGEVEIVEKVWPYNLDLMITEVDLPTSWAGLYIFRPEEEDEAEDLYLNKRNMENLSDDAQQFVTTHELGHALGLGHSYWENIMLWKVTEQTTLGLQDKEDYYYCWVDDNDCYNYD